MMEHRLTFCCSIFLVLYLATSEEIANECGKVEFIDAKILGGTQVTRGSWPFIAALYYSETSKFFCGGTLISSKNTLTAAHCVHQKNSAHELIPSDVIVLLGAYNLETKIERGTQQRNVDNIYIHPDWRVFNDKYDADLAILELSELVVFTNLIRPVCMPDASDVVNDVEGWIVGWGLAEYTKPTKHEVIPRQALTRSLNDTYCYTTNHLVASFSSSRSFCGGGDEVTPNKGDSGGGFFVYSGSAWFQYGIISAALSDNTGRVKENSFSIYTNVKNFRSWIDEKISKSGMAVMSIGKDRETMELTCNYDLILNVNYRCTLRGLQIEKEYAEVCAGLHIDGYTAQNVSEIWFWSGTSEYIPRGIGKIFVNLEKFMVSDDDRNLGLKVLKRSNFKSMEFLSYLNVRSNNIEIIDEDTLHDLPSLKDFIINHNKVQVLHKNIFATNLKLKTVYAISNKLEFLHEDLFKLNTLLEEAVFTHNRLVRISINFTELKQIKVIDFRGNVCIDKDLHYVQSLKSFQALVRNECA